jgi:hypothetical protein
MKILITNPDNNEQAVFTDMYLWFLLWEQMKIYHQETTDYKIELIKD